MVTVLVLVVIIFGAIFPVSSIHCVVVGSTTLCLAVGRAWP